MPKVVRLAFACRRLALSPRQAKPVTRGANHAYLNTPGTFPPKPSGYRLLAPPNIYRYTDELFPQHPYLCQRALGLTDREREGNICTGPINIYRVI